MYQLFIRLDRKGHWRGVDHRSSVCGLGDEFENMWEDGISCYYLDPEDLAYPVEELRSYWMDVAMLDDPEEYEDFQVTVFCGDRLAGYGANDEDLATCLATVIEVDARPFLEAIISAFELYDDLEISEEEYSHLLIEALKKQVTSKIAGNFFIFLVDMPA